MNDPVIGRELFADGSERDVFQTVDGRQYVVGDPSEPVFGVGLLTGDAEADMSLIVLAG